jgi:outer membrane receptor protein involved in Fe transport
MTGERGEWAADLAAARAADAAYLAADAVLAVEQEFRVTAARRVAARRDAERLVALITDALLDGNIHGQHPDQTARLTRAKALARAALQRLIGGDS